MTLEGGFSGLKPNEKCEGCRAVVDQVQEQLGKQRYTESNVMDVLEGLCAVSSQVLSQQRFAAYKFPPPKMVAACAYFMDSHEEQLESFFFELKSAQNFKGQETSDKLCKKITGICEGIEEEESRMERQEVDVYMDGKPQAVQDNII
jgi:hypothetical protein